MSTHRIQGGRDAQISLGGGDGVTPHDELRFEDGPTIRAARPGQHRPATGARAHDDFPSGMRVVSNGSSRATLRRGADADGAGAVTLMNQQRRETQAANLREVGRALGELPLPPTGEERIGRLAAPPTVASVIHGHREYSSSPQAWGRQAVAAGVGTSNLVAAYGFGRVAGSMAARGAPLMAGTTGFAAGATALGAVGATAAFITVPVAASLANAERARNAADARQPYDDQVRAIRERARLSEGEGRAAALSLDVTSSSQLPDAVRQRLMTDGDYARAFRATIHQRIDQGQLDARR